MAKRTKDENADVLASAALDSAAPAWIKPYVQKVVPVVTAIGKFIDFVEPYVVKAWTLGEAAWKAAGPYYPELVIPMIIGLIMMMFGGYFMLTIACVEAYRICGWTPTRDAIVCLYEDYARVREASQKDDQEDADGDGVADVLQIDKKQLLTRKLRLYMTTSNPARVADALSAIYTGFIAVLATLKLQFARTVALGASIGDVLSKAGVRFLKPILEIVIPQEYHKWIDVALGYGFKMIGVSIAWSLQRVLTAFHSAARGAQLFTDAFAVYTAKLGYKQLSVGYYDEAFALVVCLLGLKVQLSSGFVLPWFLSILLFPLLWIEYTLSWVIVYQ